MSWEHLTGERRDWSRDERIARISDTWSRLEGRITARHKVVFVRTDTPNLVTAGGIHIPEKEGDFLVHRADGKNAWATVVAAGDEADVTPGDRVLFPRFQFAWARKFDDGTYLGWVPTEHLLMVDTGDDDEVQAHPERSA